LLLFILNEFVRYCCLSDSLARFDFVDSCYCYRFFVLGWLVWFGAIWI